MDKRFMVASVAIFVVWMALDFVVHGVLIGPDYAALTNLYRTPADSQPLFPLMLLAHVLLALALVWIYARGAEAAKPWLGQGLRFGVAVALLTVVPTYLIYYVVQPTPVPVVIKQIVFSTVSLLILGAVVAWFYRAPRGLRRASAGS
jgi:hypothetical protein